MISLGIDQSLGNTAFVVCEDFNLVWNNLLQTKKEEKSQKDDVKKKSKKKDVNELIEKFDRQKKIFNEALKMMLKFKPDLVCYEGYNYVGKSLDIQAEVVGVIGLAFSKYREIVKKKVFVINFSPQSVKKYVLGKGAGQKKELLLKEVYKKFKVDYDDNNLCDAFIISQMGCDLLYLIENKKFRKGIKSYQKEIFEKTFSVKEFLGEIK